MKIAVFDVDITRLALICSVLHSANHQTRSFSNGHELLQNLRVENIDMLILEWRIPNQHAAEVMHWIRENFPSTFPVLFITSYSDGDGILEGLEAGATDYIVKPLRPHELNTRVQTLLRRAYPTQHQRAYIEFGHYVFETQSTQLSMSGKIIELTHKEFDLALLLFRHLDRPLSRAFMLDAVWPQKTDVPSRTLDTHISRVRNKLKLHPENGYQLVPVYSYGYQLLQINVG